MTKRMAESVMPTSGQGRLDDNIVSVFNDVGALTRVLLQNRHIERNGWNQYVVISTIVATSSVPVVELAY